MPASSYAVFSGVLLPLTGDSSFLETAVFFPGEGESSAFLLIGEIFFYLLDECYPFPPLIKFVNPFINLVVEFIKIFPAICIAFASGVGSITFVTSNSAVGLFSEGFFGELSTGLTGVFWVMILLGVKSLFGEGLLTKLLVELKLGT